MRKMTNEEVRNIQIDILDVVSSFCDDNHIKYWIDSGTLLGAVRHKGYIPWDDDIDIGMLRPDFDKFMIAFNANRNDKYKFVSGEITDDFNAAHGKVLDTSTILYEPDINGFKLAVNIDVFVYDNAPDDDKLVKKMFDKRDFYRFLSEYRYLGRINENNTFAQRIIKRVFFFFLHLFPKDHFVKKMARNARRYQNVRTPRIGNFTAYSRTVCRVDAFDNTIPMEFEGKVYQAPKGWDDMLKAMFGDYMTLPPVEKRIPHSYVAFVKDKEA